MRKIWSAIILSVLGVILLVMVSEMPPFGDPNNPSNNIVSERFSEQIIEDTNVPNIVTAIITDYRGYDTLGEATVLFTSIAAVLTVLTAHMDAAPLKDVNDDDEE